MDKPLDYYETRKLIDKMKRERDYAEYLRGQIKTKGTDKGPDGGQFKGAGERATVLNNLMRHRGE